jgi:hypothetical protein
MRTPPAPCHALAPFERRCRGGRDGRRYNSGVITRGIREFVGRDWQAVRASKDAYWGERIRRRGPAEGWRIADELRHQARLQHPDWPTAADRDEDLRAHLHLASILSRAGSTRRA